MLVQLEPQHLRRVGARGGDVRVGEGGVGGDALDDAGRVGATGEVGFAGGVAEACERSGADEYGEFGRGGEECGGGVAGGDGPHNPGHEEEAGKCYRVLVMRWRDY